MYMIKLLNVASKIASKPDLFTNGIKLALNAYEISKRKQRPVNQSSKRKK